MYEAYWELSEPPFDNSPNPKFFYLSPEHEEALVRLVYTVSHRKGCGMLTGEYGCGKTTLARALIQRLEAERYEIGLLTNPSWNALDFLREVLYQLGVETEANTKPALLHALNDIFYQNYQAVRDIVVIVDEDQLIEDDGVFEELRLLLNFQTDDRVLVTLLLAGSPHLDRELRRTDEQEVHGEPFVRLEVQQQPELLEDPVVLDQLGLVHDHHAVTPGLVVLVEDIVQRVEERGLGVRLRLDAELVEDLAEEVQGVPARVREQADLVALGLEALDERARERRLATTVLTGEHPAALAVADRVDEAHQRLLVLGRQVEELRVRRVVERRFAELPVRFVHRLFHDGPVEDDEEPGDAQDQRRDRLGDRQVVLPPPHRDLGHRHDRARLERRGISHRA